MGISPSDGTGVKFRDSTKSIVFSWCSKQMSIIIFLGSSVSSYFCCSRTITAEKKSLNICRAGHVKGIHKGSGKGHERWVSNWTTQRAGRREILSGPGQRGRKLWCRWSVWLSNLLRSWSIGRPEAHYLVHSIQTPAVTFTLWILEKITSRTTNQTASQTENILFI